MTRFLALSVIIAFALVAAFAGDVSAQQQIPTTEVAQTGPPADAVKVATTPPGFIETPENFRGLIGKWKYDENVKFLSNFEVKSVSKEGTASDLHFKVGGRDAENAILTVTAHDGKLLQLEITVNLGKWELKWDRRYPKILDGKISGPGVPQGIQGRFYREE